MTVDSCEVSGRESGTGVFPGNGEHFAAEANGGCAEVAGTGFCGHTLRLMASTDFVGGNHDVEENFAGASENVYHVSGLHIESPYDAG